MEINHNQQPPPLPARHLVAMPSPGRGHINPMLNLCKLLLLTNPNDLLITFVVTEEWLGLLSSDSNPPPPPNLRFSALPQVIPSEHGRAADFPGFFEAVLTKLEDPFDRLLDRLQPPASFIIYDSYLYWAVSVGNRRNIPVAAFFTVSASFATVFVHFDLLIKHGHFPLDVSERGDEVVDYIPGLAPTTIADMPTIFHGNGNKVYRGVLESISALKNAQYVVFSSIYEFEAPVLDCLKAKLGIPVYHIGPMIPYFNLKQNTIIDNNSYFQWLDLQPKYSVLYISQGSFLSVSSDQTKEFVEGVKESGVRFLWVTRGDSSQFKDGVDETGLLVPWCDQLKVLCHPSIGGFWTHCGWNSTSEGIYAGVPMLTCPIFWDQIPNSKLIVNDLKIGWRVMKNGVVPEKMLTRQEVAALVRKFMDSESDERKEMVVRAKNASDTFKRAVEDGGSAASDLASFVNSI
ncbi:UDP-glycosyltransferase 87A1-like [Silene latifolia]|uniref:UDP-glycosyltransferase 87A1-like n=1 Tax=Silene latifolia TaxID=37657 RepID=UPI003D774FE8